MSERNGHSLDPVSSTLEATRVGDTGPEAVSVPFQHSRDPGRSPRPGNFPGLQAMFEKGISRTIPLFNMEN